MPLPRGGLGGASPGNDNGYSSNTSLEKGGGVHVPRPKAKAKRTKAKKVSSRKGPDDKNIEGYTGSGGDVATSRKLAKDPMLNSSISATKAINSVGEISDLVVSELATLGEPDNQITQQLRFPVYGNYCGFGHGDPTGNTPPIDAVDAVCREHDLCYRLLGDFDDRCDRNLIEIMPSAIASTPSPVGKKAGLLGLLYFSLAERNLALGKTLFKRT